ncbi:dihydrofolate reductase family protein [Paenibacillus tarimensis]|uniref:dihydrofolate reductase family protein n=1 Tax=Paenibacillus tarimensis TaxID=416012 RepID=UPI001F29B96C|nr:dihydrofolate reductase family protein [Paenibacillus tarimensis]MCF2943303.1 dihydrofolate reductase family protein [Paenibacillus tarimensis]
MNHSKNKIVLYIAMSLDGYIARPDGSVDWLYDVEGDGGDNGYGRFYSSVGSVVMGRLTYEVVRGLQEDFPYTDKPCYVLTRTKTTEMDNPHAQYTDKPLKELLPELQGKSDGDVWIVGGGQVVKACLRENLLDEMQIAVIPKVLGSGIPLFPEGSAASTYRLTNTELLGQIVMLTYNRP